MKVIGLACPKYKLYKISFFLLFPNIILVIEAGLWVFTILCFVFSPSNGHIFHIESKSYHMIQVVVTGISIIHFNRLTKRLLFASYF